MLRCSKIIKISIVKNIAQATLAGGNASPKTKGRNQNPRTKIENIKKKICVGMDGDATSDLSDGAWGSGLDLAK